MTVEELINNLKNFPKDMEVLDSDWFSIERVYEDTWIDSNYPYDKPDKKVVILY